MSNTECNMLLLKLYGIIISFFIVFWGKKGGGNCSYNETHQMLYDILVLTFKIYHRMSQISDDNSFGHCFSMNKKNGGNTSVIVNIFFFNFDVFSFLIKQEMELYTIEYEEFLSLDPSCSSKTIFVWPSKGQGDFWAWEPLEKTLKVNTTLFVR